MIRISIQGMSCENCVRHVQAALSGLDGVAAVQLSLAAGEAIVEARDPVDEAAIRSVLADEGYEVTAIEHA